MHLTADILLTPNPNSITDWPNQELVGRLDITRKQWIDRLFRSGNERKGLSYESM